MTPWVLNPTATPIPIGVDRGAHTNPYANYPENGVKSRGNLIVISLVIVLFAVVLLMAIYSYWRTCGEIVFPGSAPARRGSGGNCQDGFLGYYIN